MQLSIVILCWNDLKVIKDCLTSLYAATHSTDFKVIVSDNGSTDGSCEFIRTTFPQVRIVENGRNLGFAGGNNAGIHVSTGKYILILNPDTIIHDGALDRWIEFADRHPSAGAFGCRVLNPDGSNQGSARPFPSVWRDWIAALYLRPLAYISDVFISDTYTTWKGDTVRTIDWQSGCCVMFRGELLKNLGGFDKQFFYHNEEVDLCRRVWGAGYTIIYTPEVTITHLGGQSVSRFPIRFALETHRSRYKYYYKHHGESGVRHCRWAVLARLKLRQIGYGAYYLFRPSKRLAERLAMYRVCLEWNSRIDPMRFVTNGDEPKLSETVVSESQTA